MITEITNTISKIGSNFNKEKLNSLLENPNFLEELKVITSISDGIDYYKKIISLEINKENPNNSYIMWIFDKVEKIDLDKRVKIVEAKYSLPDIDTDFPTECKKGIFEYLKFKYGKERVSQIATFGKLKGAGALKEVFRVLESCDQDTANMITKKIPLESLVADEMEEENEESLILWCLKHKDKDFRDYCYINENGELEGPFSKEFQYAIDLEGTIKTQGMHPAGIVICREDISKHAPMIYNKSSDDPIIGLSMSECETVGLIKFDVLAVACLSKLQTVNNLLKYGKLKND